DGLAKLINNGIPNKVFPIVVQFTGCFTDGLTKKKDICVCVTRSLLFIVYIFKLHPCRDIGSVCELLHKKRNRDSFYFQKIIIGINIGKSSLLKQNHYLSPYAVRFLSTT